MKYLVMVQGSQTGYEAMAGGPPSTAPHGGRQRRPGGVRGAGGRAGAHLLERAGDTAAARGAYRRAASRTLSAPETRCPRIRAARLREEGGTGGDTA
ncbi:hypothetical protein QMZ92_31365 [Streptomyces sp. HNM0645]|uniref:hypothetical protein n=1 Tax=Streptomyces sp. HNM0645 TaxID=2782343 RepID=UPI0024B79AC2|nr:hypothetical protein [Streptomyces sp. HNM0645]MDI9888731.1 hypothetical protein [Streptomyces sp. HNM0645]